MGFNILKFTTTINSGNHKIILFSPREFFIKFCYYIYIKRVRYRIHGYSYTFISYNRSKEFHQIWLFKIFKRIYNILTLFRIHDIKKSFIDINHVSYIKYIGIEKVYYTITYMSDRSLYKLRRILSVNASTRVKYTFYSFTVV